MAAYTSKKSSLAKFYGFLLNFGKITCSLPLNSDATFILKVIHSFGCFVSALNTLGLLTLAALTVYKRFDEKIFVIELLSLIMLYSEGLLNMLLWQFKKSELQKFLQELEDFFADSQDHKQKMINKYFNRYKLFYIFFIIFIIGTFFLRIISAPIHQHRKLPFEIYYPFTIEPNTVIHYIIFFLQSIATFYSGVQLVFPMMITTIFIHAVVKLELLVNNLKQVKNPKEFTLWIEQHLDCIRHIERLNEVLGILIMKTYTILGLSIIFGSIKLIYNPSIYVVAKTFGTISSLLIGTYIYNGPADDIYEMSEVLGYTLYNLEWCDKLTNMSKLIIISMNRVQKPFVISPLKGLMPALNRKIYTNFLSYLISYIMTLRAIVSSQ